MIALKFVHCYAKQKKILLFLVGERINVPRHTREGQKNTHQNLNSSERLRKTRGFHYALINLISFFALSLVWLVLKLFIYFVNSAIFLQKRTEHYKDFNKNVYKLRHLVENAFLHLNRWKSIATRYAQNSALFLAAAQIRCLVLWLTMS